MSKHADTINPADICLWKPDDSGLFYGTHGKVKHIMVDGQYLPEPVECTMDETCPWCSHAKQGS